MKPLVLLALAGLAAPLGAQTPLSLSEALARADRHAWANRSAEAGLDLQAALRDQTLKGLLPSVRAEGGWVRTTDPLNAFGFALRQRSVTQQSFAPDLLNHPAPISNIGTGVVAEVPLINPDVWLGRGAAQAAVRAADASARWTRYATRLEVVRAYFGGVLAHQQVAALEAGHAAARSHVRRAESMLTQGLVTRSDALLAEVKAGEVETQLLGARAAAALASRQLALVLGLPEDTALVLPGRMPAAETLAGLAGNASDAPRADVEAARYGVEAARKDERRATATWLPRINSFGRVDWNHPDRPLGGASAWTVGVMASWSLFGGGQELVERRAAEARRASAEAMAEAALARAGLEQAERRAEVDVALASVAIAARAVDQAAEAHRIVTRKYDGGLATVTELLEASAIETRTRLAQAHALYRAVVAIGAWRLAQGHDLTDLTVLDR